MTASTTPCELCGGHTKTVKRNKKADNSVFYMLQCEAGCVNPSNPQYKHTFFPPKPEPAAAPPPPSRAPQAQQQPAARPPQAAPAQATPGQNVSLAVLKQIEAHLRDMLTIMQKTSGVVPVHQHELEPTDEIPF